MNPAKDSPADDLGIGGGAKSNMTPLPLDFVPGNFDVLCGRGKKNYNSTGNQRLRRIVESYVEPYSSASSRQDKSDILSTIVNEVRSASPNGGFIKQEPNSERWFEVGDFLAREKVSQAFRDALSFQYRSSKKFKHEKRRQRDKAAKVAKQQKDGTTGARNKPSKRKSMPNIPSSPLQRRERLSVLREEPMTSSTSFIPQRQGNAEPNRRSGMMMFQGAQSQFLGDPSATHFGGQYPAQQDMLFPPANQMFDAVRAGANAQAVAMEQHERRFSEAMMASGGTGGAYSSMVPHQHALHQSDPNLNWSPHMGYPGAAASLHASFPTGMGFHAAHAGAAGMLGAGMAMANMPHAAASAGGATNTLPLEQTTRSQQQQRRSRSLPLERSGSNVSTSSATAIVARLESALPGLSQHQDENPFEPVPLPGGAKQGDDEDDSIIHNW